MIACQKPTWCLGVLFIGPLIFLGPKNINLSLVFGEEKIKRLEQCLNPVEYELLAGSVHLT
jgi:hypothetical protein